jgi:hypothetical protein
MPIITTRPADLMVRLTPRGFLNQLEQLYQGAQPNSVYLTFKHFTGVYSVKHSGRGPLKRMPKSVTGADPGTPMVLVRATDGNNRNFSTIVPKSEYVAFNIGLQAVMKQPISEYWKTVKNPRSTHNK